MSRTTHTTRQRRRMEQANQAASVMMTATEARELLGVSRYKMTRLLALGAEQGGLASHRDPVDMRIKLVARADVERLLRGA